MCAALFSTRTARSLDCVHVGENESVVRIAASIVEKLFRSGKRGCLRCLMDGVIPS